ncbi:MAG: hypothetical protein ACREBG_19535 [Pyrinomonadaceae bacterium]
MAGLIKLNKDQSWGAAGWVFDHVLRLTRKHLPEEGSSRVLKLIDDAATGLNYMSLEELSPPEMSIFHEALQRAYLEIESEGSSSFNEPSFYAAFMERFKELLEMIRSAGDTT